MGCSTHEDSLDHYAHCKLIRKRAQQKLNLHINPLESKETWSLTKDLAEKELQKVAYMIYASYRTTNYMRQTCKKLEQEDKEKRAKQYWQQIIHEADKGSHKFCLKKCDTRTDKKRPTPFADHQPPKKKKPSLRTHEERASREETGDTHATINDQNKDSHTGDAKAKITWTRNYRGMWTRSATSGEASTQDNERAPSVWTRRRRLNNSETLPIQGNS